MCRTDADTVPNSLTVTQTDVVSVRYSAVGPTDPEAMKPDDYKSTKPLFDCGFACTTYPEGQGLWSLICDMFNFKSFPNWKVVALADGCNWVRIAYIHSLSLSCYSLCLLFCYRNHYTRCVYHETESSVTGSPS